MAAVREERLERNRGLTPKDEWDRKRASATESSEFNRDDDEEEELTEEEAGELKIARFCRGILRSAIEARRPFETFDKAWDLFNGDMFPPGMPRWKSRIVINKIRAFILFMQAIMTDNKPRVNIKPIVPGSEDVASLLGMILDKREWDDSKTPEASTLAALYGLIFGTGICKVIHDPEADGGRGKREVMAIPSYRVFFNPGCKSVEDAEYIVHIEKMPLGWIARHFPNSFEKVKTYANRGMSSELGEFKSRDLVNEGTSDYTRSRVETAMSMDGHTVRQSREPKPVDGLDPSNFVQVEVAEFWFHDDVYEPYERIKRKNGVPVYEPVMDEYGLPELELNGEADIQISPLDGLPFAMPGYRVKMKPVYETAKRRKYPNGRVVTMAGPVVMRDIPNPYQIDGFPFADWKDVDVGNIWGQGEPLGLKDANIGMNRVISMLYDNINLAGNTSWVVDKSAGLNVDVLRNRPAQIIPIEDVNGIKPLDKPPITGEFLNLFNTLRGELPGIAGLNDTILGGAPMANTSFATVDQLQENAASIIRQKVRNFERMLARIGKILVAMIQQFDSGDRPIQDAVAADNNRWEAEYSDPDAETGESHLVAIVQPAGAVEAKWTVYSQAMLKGTVEVGIEPDSSLSTSPAGLFNRLMVLLDKRVIDDEYVVEKLNLEDGKELIKRKRAHEAAQAQMKQKPGPKPGAGATKKPRAPGPPVARHVPTAAANAAVR